MADFVRDHISLGEIAGRLEALMKLAKKREIEIDFLIVAAIKRSRGGLGEAAGRLNLVGEEHKLGLRVSASGTLEDLAPGAFRATEHAGDEFPAFVATGSLRFGRWFGFD